MRPPRPWLIPAFLMGVATLALTTAACTTTGSTYVADDYAAWKSTPLPDSSGLLFTAFLVGDTGYIHGGDPDPVFQTLAAQMATADSNSAIVFLGDNVYCCGLPDPQDPSYEEKRDIVDEHLDLVRDFPGQIVFLPGNHDWNHSKRGGLERVRRQERYVEGRLGRGNTWLPDDGFPGPVTVPLTDGIRLVVVDTQWWLHPFEKPYGYTGEYQLESPDDVVVQLDHLVQRYEDEQLLVVAHHPMFTNGTHGGYFPARDHLFPLGKKSSIGRYIPLPLLGSLLPLTVRYGGGLQDVSHPLYRTMQRSFVRTFSQHERLIFASGHDHNLQLFPYGQEGPVQHYVVSGGGSDADPIARGRRAAFASGSMGHAVLRYYRDGAVWIEYFYAGGELAFRSELYAARDEEPEPERVAEVVGPPPTPFDSAATVAPNPSYRTGPIQRILLGSQHRALWATPVEVEVLDLGSFAGGLVPDRRGGGAQTRSLRFRSGDGRTFTLRGLDRDPDRSVPQDLRGTIALNVARDQTLSLNPFGPLLVAPLAGAAGLTHHTPRLVFVPNDARLGRYRQSFGDQLMLIEETPVGNQLTNEAFGNAPYVVSSAELYQTLNGDPNALVDQRVFARHRLFDILIGDWDRGREKWRWGRYFENGRLVFRPIPRDRDWAFSRVNGIFPTIARQLAPRYQTFEDDITDLRGLTEQALAQDRRLTNELTRAAWIQQARILQQNLPDSVITAAIAEAWPEPVRERIGKETARILQERRDALAKIAADYFDLLADAVDVVGTAEAERFVVERPSRDSVTVAVYGSVGSRLLYRRGFASSETDEVRIYGLGGADAFDVSGPVAAGPVLRIIGGPGADTFDVATPSVRRGNTSVYDTETGNTYALARGTRLVQGSNVAVNFYDPEEYRYNRWLPEPMVAYDAVRGAVVGATFSATRYAFRRYPYSEQHDFVARYATGSQSFDLMYRGRFPLADGRLVGTELRWQTPGTKRPFYGYGNSVGSPRAHAFYETDLNQVRADVYRQSNAEPAIITNRLTTSATYTRVDVSASPSLRADSAAAMRAGGDQLFLAVRAEGILSTVEAPLNPRFGLRLALASSLHQGFLQADERFARFSGDLRYYYTLERRPQLTTVVRIGGERNVGAFPYYEAITLGSESSLRGYRPHRFSGRASLYQGAEARFELLRFSNYISVGQIGVLAFLDNGRVWAEDERSGRWHQGYGGGLWAHLFDAADLTLTFAASHDDQLITFQSGFQF